mmetsp:Transcript_32133/g.49117  ORF Transcript_32133/g.49117 Transcript_32133/m.49117 type:complete len:100 (-) Transcript_32133:74-373(-)
MTFNKVRCTARRSFCTLLKLHSALVTFLDLAVLVESQQVDIDSVERHALETYDQAERGVVHLEQAAQYSKKQFGLSKSGLGASILLICIFMTTMYFALH